MLSNPVDQDGCAFKNTVNYGCLLLQGETQPAAMLSNLVDQRGLCFEKNAVNCDQNGVLCAYLDEKGA